MNENLSWCTEVMNVEKFGEVRPGTVLSLNGYRKYVSVYKPSEVTNSEYSRSQEGDLMGFNDSDSESDSLTADAVTNYNRKRHKVISLAVRKEFPTWLERLSEGMIKRRKVEEWPSMDA